MLSASENNGHPFQDDDARLLVPWHVTGKLNDAMIRKLDDLALQDLAFARLLEEATKEAEATILLYDRISGPSPEVWERLEGTIEARSGEHVWVRASVARSGQALIRRYLDRFSTVNWKYAAAVALTICIIQSTAIAYLAGVPESSRIAVQQKFTAASGPKTVPTPAQFAFILQFSETAKIADIIALFDEAGVTIVEGPLPDNVFRVSLKVGNTQARKAVQQKLRTSPLVKRVL